MYFAGVLGIYFQQRAQVRNSGNDWIPEDARIELTPPGMVMWTLLISCAVIQWAVYSIARDDRPHALIAVGATLAMGAMVMNMSSNILGMGNAATPFGLKAMKELARINHRPGVASDSMVLFLAVNTSAITLLPPLGTIAIRLAAGSADPFEIWVPTLLATTCSTVGAVTAFFLLRRLPAFADRPGAPGSAPLAAPPRTSP